jgi:hypothetical protein
MSITLSPSKAAYLAKVAEGLADLPVEDREEVVQDLEAHLAELDDDEVEATLGPPEVFVAEFRQSAGLVESETVSTPGIVERLRARLEEWSARLSEMTHWQSFRPVWLWARGWLLVSAWSLLYDIEGFSRFPIPSIGGSSLTGLVLVVGATLLSLWLDAGTQQARSIGSVVFSVAAGWALVGMLLNPLPTYAELHGEEIYIDRLTGPDGSWVENIYAYTLEGEQVDVLLFDQSGRPLLSLPTHAYEEAEFAPNAEVIHYDSRAVAFARDQFGRVIPNLYPLQLSTYDEIGRLVPMPPPSLGFPTIEEDEAPDDENPVPTTTTPPFG